VTSMTQRPEAMSTTTSNLSATAAWWQTFAHASGYEPANAKSCGAT
jgi:hypothetical protein